MNETEKSGVIALSKVLSYDIKAVWAAFADEAAIGQWYGPQDFTCSISKMDFKMGGDWELTLHGPDGKDYPNTNRFIEVITESKIVYAHQSEPFFTATILFEPKGAKTLVNWTMQFHDMQEFDAFAKGGNPTVGLKQNLDKLEVFLMGLED